METNKNRKLIFNSLLLVGAMVVCMIIASISITPQTYDIKQGEISEQTITANKNIVDEITTNNLIEEEQAKVGVVYTRDEDLNNTIIKKVQEDMTSFSNARAYAKEVFDAAEQKKLADSQAAIEKVQQDNDNLPVGQDKAPLPALYTVQSYDPMTTDVVRILTRENTEHLDELFPQYIYTTDYSTILNMADADMASLNTVLTDSVKEEISKDIYAQDIDGVRNNVLKKVLSKANLTNQEGYIINKLITNALVANMTYDEEATAEQKKAIEKNFVPVEYKKGQNIVVKGEIVTAAQYQTLKSLGLLQAEVSSFNPYMVVIIYILLTFVLYTLFLIRFNLKLLYTTKKVAILCILTVVAYASTALMQILSTNIYPIILFAILGAILLSPKNAIIYSIFLSLLLVSVTVGGHDIFSSDTLIILLNMILGSFFAVYVLKNMKFRSTLIIAGLAAVIPAVVIQYLCYLLNILNLSQFGITLLIITLSGFMCGVISIGVLPIIESAFKLTTPSKLLELSAPNNPLLKRLVMEAPGTYNHSILVANLAEAACNEVGGFSLLARVGAYFHDIGKVNHPMFYKENQKNNINPHDNLVPIQSANIIMDHVTDGVELLKSNKIPQEIIDICISHHGNSVMGYFYAQAKNKDENVNIDDFKYTGFPPTTKEGAIVMLADSVEAAVRSLESSDKEEIEAMVRKIIKSKYDEGQLDFAPLNRKDLEIITQAFMKIFEGIYHTRVKYPELKIHGVEDEDNVI